MINVFWTRLNITGSLLLLHLCFQINRILFYISNYDYILLVLCFVVFLMFLQFLTDADSLNEDQSKDLLSWLQVTLGNRVKNTKVRKINGSMCFQLHCSPRLWLDFISDVHLTSFCHLLLRQGHTSSGVASVCDHCGRNGRGTTFPEDDASR